MDTVLITGCSSGIGRATALAFREAGWEVYATSREVADLEDLDAAGCRTAALDVTDAEQVSAVVDRVDEEVGGVDCLVNNAGYGQFGPLEDLPTREVRQQFEVNAFGPHRLIRAVLPGMRSGNGGAIITVSSWYGRLATPVAGAYAGSKAAIEAMSDALRVEVADDGIDVVLVEPGAVATNFNDRAQEQLPAPSERTPTYARFYRAFEDGVAITGSGGLASEPADVAGVILEAAESEAPAARYPIGTMARLASVARFIPDRLREAVFRFVVSRA